MALGGLEVPDNPHTTGWLLLVFQNWPWSGSTSLLAASGVSELALRLAQRVLSHLVF